MREVEFLPERIVRHRERRRRLGRQGALLAIVVLAMAALTAARQHRISSARAELAVMGDTQASLQRQIALIAPLERQMADLMIKKRIDDELGSRTDSTCVLAEFCRLMPANMALTSFDLRTVELRPEAEKLGSSRSRFATGPKEGDAVVRRVRLTIIGVAPTDVDVANFIGQMSASPLFEDVNMGYTKTVNIEDRAGREFQVSCLLVR